MTGRELHKEWIGRRATSRVPRTVRERLLEAAEGKCQGPCHQPIGIGNPFDVDHVVELKDWLGEGHGNRESNLQLLCRKICHKRKSKLAKIVRAQASRTREHLMGQRAPARNPIPGSKASGWAHRWNKYEQRWEWIKR